MTTVLHGVAAAPGLALGPARVVRPLPQVDEQARRTGDAEAEKARLAEAIGRARQQLETLAAAAAGPTAEMLGALREMVDDPELRDGAEALIDEGFTAEAAFTRVANTYAAMLAELPDEYLAARADDVRQTASRVIAALTGTFLDARLTTPAILVARDLSPAETVGMDTTLLLGIVTEGGSATGHLAIVAQGLGVPAVVGVAGALDSIVEGTLVAIDGGAGTVSVAPDARLVSAVHERLAADARAAEALAVYRDQRGHTADGTAIEVFANIGTLAEARKAVEMGAEGVGLFRTELLAVDGLPDEDTQYATYTAVAETLKRPLVVRTFDIGGDKPVPGLDIPSEMNPFLGWRGIRLGLDRPEQVLLPQLRALLRAGANADIRLLLPMVNTPDEVQALRKQMARARQALAQAGMTVRELPVGIMVETPAAALTLDTFVGVADFASIGTNDLTQYTYAVDRTNASVRDRAHPLGLAMLRLIEATCRAGLPVAVCGQLAGDVEAVPLLVGLGVRELSMAPSRIPQVKQLLASLSLPEMQAQAAQALRG